MFNKLAPNDIKLIENYILNYATDNELIRDPASLEYRLRFWADNKNKYLAKMFNGNLILKREIEYTASEDELLNIFMKDNDSDQIGKFYNNFWRVVSKEKAFYNIVFGPAITTNTGIAYHSIYSYLTAHSTLVSNRWSAPETIFPLPDGKSFKVNTGTKISRIFGKLARAWSIEGWEAVREAQAKALTTKTIKGTLCLSIHPMDYMTMSDNKESWKSCMNWTDRGGYRAGTIEMLNSPNVVIAYLEHPKNTFEGWNSKIWRELFIVTPDIITNIKAYPFLNDWLTKYVLSWLKELAESAGVSAYEGDLKVLYDPDENNNRELTWFDNHNIHFEFLTDTMYNDTKRVPQYCYVRNDMPFHKRTIWYSINYSGERVCMICGEKEEIGNDSSELVCKDCSEFKPAYWCDHCGEAILTKDEAYWLDDLILCGECYEDKAIMTYDDPEEYHSRDDCEKVYICLPNGELTYNYTYVYNMDIITTEYYGPMANYQDIPTMNSKFYIPYRLASTNLKRACGLSSEECREWDSHYKSHLAKKIIGFFKRKHN